MAGPKIEWTSTDAQVLRTFEKVEKGFDEIARRMQRVEDVGRKMTQTTETGFDKATKKVVGMAQALIGGGSLLTAVDMIRRANEEMIRQADEAAKKYDDLFRKFRVQAGLSELGAEQAKASILKVAERNAVTSDVATAGAMGLVGAGFTTKDASGAGLDVLLRTQAAMNAQGKPIETETLAKQAAAYFTSQGMASTPQNLQKLMEDSFALRAGAFELSDLAEMGKYGAVFKGKLSQQEQLAAFGTLRDAFPAAESGTAMRNMVLKLTAGGRTTEDALKRLGLDRTDTDLIGENFGTAMDRIAAGLQSVPEEEREPILKMMFEEAGVAPAKLLLNERGGKYAAYQRGMRTSAGEFAGAAGIAQAGPNAAAIRLQLRKESRASNLAQSDDLYQAALEEEFAEQGESPASRFFAKQGYNLARGLGFSQETAGSFAYGNAVGGLTGPTGVTGAARQQLNSDFLAPMRVEIVNPNGGPAVQNNAVRGFGR